MNNCWLAGREAHLQDLGQQQQAAAGEGGAVGQSQLQQALGKGGHSGAFGIRLKGLKAQTEQHGRSAAGRYFRRQHDCIQRPAKTDIHSEQCTTNACAMNGQAEVEDDKKGSQRADIADEHACAPDLQTQTHGTF